MKQILRNTIKLECKKAVFNKFFLLSILIGCAITFFSLIPRLQSYYQDVGDIRQFSKEFSVVYNPVMQMETLFNHWIGGEPVTPGSADYFFLFPLLIAIPYGWSYCAEKRSGYVKNMVIRTGRLGYHLSKYLSLFLSGGLVMVIPLFFNFLLTAIFVPAVLPDPSYLTAYGIISSSYLSMLFYSHPFLYVFLYLLTDFVFCGLLACLCFALSVFVKSRVAVVLLPFFILLAFKYICSSLIYTSPNIVYTELSPMMFLRPAPAAYAANGFVIAIEGAILFLFTFYMTVFRGRHSEIY